MYSKDELLAKSPEELEAIAKALGSNLTASDGPEALASFIIGDYTFDEDKDAEEEKPKRKTRARKSVAKTEDEGEAPKKRNRRTAKKTAENAVNEDVDSMTGLNPENEYTSSSDNDDNGTETSAGVGMTESTGVEGKEEAGPAQKKRRTRRTKEEILAAAQAKAEALSLNNQKKAVFQKELLFEETEQDNKEKKSFNDDIPEFLINEDENDKTNTANTSGENTDDSFQDGTDLLTQLQAKVQAHNTGDNAEVEPVGVWDGDPGDGTDFITVIDLPVEDHYANVEYDIFDNPTSMVEEYQQNVSPAQTQKVSTYDFDDIVTANGVLEVMPDGYGFLRSSDFNYLSSPDDIFLTVQQVKKYSLKTGDVVQCHVRPPKEGEKYFPLTSIDSINGRNPNEIRDRLAFEHLTPLFPDEKFNLCGDPKTTNRSTRVVDLFSPIGKGQRALIVAQPKTGKTILMKDIANAIAANHPEAYLMMLLIDERPEEVTDMARTVNAEVIASTFDEPAERHVKIAGIVLEKAKRLVECGHDVVIFLDSITRLARAYNTVAPASGKILTGGVDANALQKPKRFFGAARNIEGGGSLTIIATALIDTGSKMDEVIFEEFKGTGNMELQLDRSLANKRIFPAVNLIQSSTRRDDLLHDKMTLDRMWILRKHIADMTSFEAMSLIDHSLNHTHSNEEFLASMNS